MNSAYTQTRLQARHGQRPDERTWQQLQAQKELASYLQTARQTVLRPWVISLHAQDSHHTIENALRQQYRDYIDDVASWQPYSWQKSVVWIKYVIDLPALQHLVSGHSAPVWMYDDPQLKSFTSNNFEQRLLRLQQSQYSPLIEAWQSGDTLLSGWLKQWQKLWPTDNASNISAIKQLVTTLQQHMTRFQGLNSEQAWEARKQLSMKLTYEFRRHTYQSLATYVHLLLVALDLERLRGALLYRCLFSETQH